MATDLRLTQCTEALTVEDTDLLYLVKDVAGTPVSRKIAASYFRSTLGILASEVAFTPYGSLSSTDVQNALEELDDEKSDISHTHAASAITFTPYGTIAATDVQNAIKELLDESAPLVHTHSKLVASDGSPDPALSADDAGNILINTALAYYKLNLAGGAHFIYDENSDIFITGDSINSCYQLDVDAQSLILNNAGYEGGYTRSRDLLVRDGMSHNIFKVDGHNGGTIFGDDFTASDAAKGLIYAVSPVGVAAGVKTLLAYEVGSKEATAGSISNFAPCYRRSMRMSLSDDGVYEILPQTGFTGILTGNCHIWASTTNYSAHVMHLNFNFDTNVMNIYNQVGDIKLADTDGYFCVYRDGNNKITVKNRLGATVMFGFEVTFGENDEIV
jgi:hypothetical protein